MNLDRYDDRDFVDTNLIESYERIMAFWKMMKYGKAYGGADPEMIKGDVFRIVVKVPEFRRIADSETQTGQLTPEVTLTVAPTVAPTVRTLLELLLKKDAC